MKKRRNKNKEKLNIEVISEDFKEEKFRSDEERVVK